MTQADWERVAGHKSPMRMPPRGAQTEVQDRIDYRQEYEQWADSEPPLDWEP